MSKIKVQDSGKGGTKHGKCMPAKTDPLILQKRIKKNSPPKKPTLRKSTIKVKNANQTNVAKDIAIRKGLKGKVKIQKRGRGGRMQKNPESVYRPFMM